MNSNVYLVEKLDVQRRQYFVDQATRDRQGAQLSNMKQTRSRAMKRMKLIAAAVLAAATL
jgi:hypothetical protein